MRCLRTRGWSRSPGAEKHSEAEEEEENMRKTCFRERVERPHRAQQRCARKAAASVALGFVLAVFLALLGCAGQRAHVAKIPAPPEVVSSEARFRKEYVLVPGDQIEVAVRGVTEASRTLTIRPDGYISLPIAAEVMASGLTPRELGEKLTEVLSARLLKPEVTVIASQIRQPMVYVQGEVAAPAALPFRTAPTAMQAIASAGGFRRTAANRDVAIIRLSEDGYLQAIRVVANVGGQPGPYMALQTALLQPDDIVFVPESGRSQFGRVVDDFLNRPVQGVNALLGTYLNFKLIQIVK